MNGHTYVGLDLVWNDKGVLQHSDSKLIDHRGFAAAELAFPERCFFWGESSLLN